MKKLWSIPIGLGYLYTITILTQYGYYSYFNIPANLIDASIPGNILYAYSLITVTWELLVGISLLWKLAIGAAIALAALLSKIFFNDHKTLFLWIGIILAAIFLTTCISLGGIIAKAKTNFLVLSPDCPPLGPAQKYIVPDLYEGKAILVPIDPTSHKLQNGLILRDLATLPCGIENEEMGNIMK